MSERIEVACPACGQRTAVAPANLGRRGRCPTCKEIFELKVPARAPGQQRASVQQRQAEPEADDLFGTFPAPATAPAADNLWNDFQTPAAKPAEDPLTVAPPPLPASQTNSLANDYLRRARDDKSLTETSESEPWYRFTTSWGSVIGGSLMMFFALPVAWMISIRLGVVMLIAGAGWFIQGLNYVFYYRWKDQR